MGYINMPAVSTEVIRFAVRAFGDGGLTNVDPTSLGVYFAFIPRGTDPVDSDWRAGSWRAADGTFWAEILVGAAGAFTGTPGAEYRVWGRVDGDVEQPHRPVGTLHIT